MMNTGKLSKNDIIELERNEIEYWTSVYQDYEGSPLKPEVRGFGPFRAFKFLGVDTLAFNRVLTESKNLRDIEHWLDEVINFYQVSSIPRFFIQLNDAVNSPENRNRLTSKGFIHYNDWTRFVRFTGILPDNMKNGLEVIQVKDEQAELYADTIVKSFDFPPSLKCHFTGLVKQPGYVLYLVQQKKETIAAGALFLRGKYASLAMAGTRPDHRGKGAQGVLLRRRLEDARMRGCHLVTVETSREIPGKPVASYRNMVRFGFKTIYHRPNFIYYTQ